MLRSRSLKMISAICVMSLLENCANTFILMAKHIVVVFVQVDNFLEAILSTLHLFHELGINSSLIT